MDNVTKLIDILTKGTDPEKYPSSGTVVYISHNLANVRIEMSSNVLKNVEIQGDFTNVLIGDTVQLQWVKKSGSSGLIPVIIGVNQSSIPYEQYTMTAVMVDDITLEVSATAGIRVKQGGIGFEHLNFKPSVEGHTHTEGLGAWTVDPDDGMLYAGKIHLRPEGQISVGLGDDIIILDSQDTTYRIWAGDITPATAPFSVSKAGAIKSTLGSIAGWTIGNDDISADNDGIMLQSTTPYIRLGAATAYGSGVGIWLGKDSGTYKFRVGDPAGNKVTWDGSTLAVTGTITATAGAIGGWTIASGDLHSAEVYIASGSSPSIRMGATAYATGVGVWMGKDGGVYKFRVGDPSGSRVAWDGSTLTITGSFQSSNYASGVSGWAINVNGDAEFNNVNVRGSIHTTILAYNEIHATAGTLGVFKSAGKLIQDVTVVTSPTTFNVDIEDPETGHAQVFATNDILRIKSESGNSWIKVNSVSDQGTFYRYVCVKQSGDNTTFEKGTGVVDYGQSGNGFITLSADGGVGSSANMTMATHAGSPWTTQTLLTRLGNLNGSYGYTDNTYGLGIGEYASGKTNIVIDQANGIRIRSYQTERITITPAGVLAIKDSGGAAVFTFDSSTGAEFTKPLSIGSAGGIWQGSSGTFSSPTTGFKLYQSSSKGIWEVWNAGIKQVYIDSSDMSLKAGMGKIEMDEYALTIRDVVPLMLNANTVDMARLYAHGGYAAGDRYTILEGVVLGSNLVTNTSFESDTSGWTLDIGSGASLTRSNDHAYKGSYAMKFVLDEKIEPTVGEYAAMQTSSYLNCGGNDVEVEFAIFNDSTATGDSEIQILVDFYNVSFGYVSSKSTTIWRTQGQPDDVWMRAIAQLRDTPATTMYMKVTIKGTAASVESGPGQSIFYIDDVRISAPTIGGRFQMYQADGVSRMLLHAYDAISSGDDAFILLNTGSNGVIQMGFNYLTGYPYPFTLDSSTGKLQLRTNLEVYTSSTQFFFVDQATGKMTLTGGIGAKTVNEPSTPSTGYIEIYPTAEKSLQMKDDDGYELAVSQPWHSAYFAALQNLPFLRGLWMGQLDGSGNLLDFSPHANHLTRTGTALLGNWFNNGAAPLYLDSRNGTTYFEIADNVDHDIIGNDPYSYTDYYGLTMGFWMRTPASGDWPAATPVIASKWNYSTSQRSYQMQIEYDTKKFALLTSSDGASGTIDGVKSADAATYETWYFVVGRMDYHTNWAIYVNGTWRTVTTGDFNSLAASTYAQCFNGSAQFRIGSAPNTAAGLKHHLYGVFLCGACLSNETIEGLYRYSKRFMVDDKDW